MRNGRHTLDFQLLITMKKWIFTFLMFGICAGSYAQEFNPANIRLGGGLSYASRVSNAGLTLTGVYEVNRQWEGALSYSYFFEKNYTRWSAFDIDGHYIFHEVSNQLNVYGLGGLSIARVAVIAPEMSYTNPMTGGEVVVSPEQTISNSYAGLNLGVGANYALTDVLNIAPELRYTIMSGGYLRIGATLQYKF